MKSVKAEYFRLTGSFIPYLALGYPSLYHYMRTLKDIVKVRNENKVLTYKVVNPETAHIANLVEKQKDSVPSARYSKVNFRSFNYQFHFLPLEFITFFVLQMNNNGTRVINSNGRSKFTGNNERNWKRKATNDGRRGRRLEKRRKNDESTRLRNWNQIYNRSASSDDGNYGNVTKTVVQAIVSRTYNYFAVDRYRS